MYVGAVVNLCQLLFSHLMARMTGSNSVAILGGVVLGGDNETASFSGAPVDGLHNVHHLLLVLQGPVDLVVVASAQINHDVLVSEEEHHCARVVQLVHLVEVRHLRDVHQVQSSKIFNLPQIKERKKILMGQLLGRQNKNGIDAREHCPAHRPLYRANICCIASEEQQHINHAQSCYNYNPPPY